MKKVFYFCFLVLCILTLTACDNSRTEITLSNEEKALLIREVDYYESIVEFKATLKLENFKIENKTMNIEFSTNQFSNLYGSDKFFYSEAFYKTTESATNNTAIADSLIYDDGVFSYQRNSDGSSANVNKVKYPTELNTYIELYGGFKLSEWLQDVNYDSIKVFEINNNTEIEITVSKAKVDSLISYYNLGFSFDIFNDNFNLPVVLTIDKSNHLSQIKVSTYDLTLQSGKVTELLFDISYNANKPQLPTSQELSTYSLFEQATFEVTFNANGGVINGNNKIRVIQHQTIEEFPIICNQGYDFGGWYQDNGEEVTETTVIDSDITLYASWDGVFEYKQFTEDEYYVQKYLGEDRNITIPSWRYRGLPVTGIVLLESANPLEQITISEGFLYIDQHAFSDQNELKKVIIPSSIVEISETAFISVSSLETVEVDANNLHYSAVAGVLFNKTKTTLIVYPASKADSSYTVLSSVVHINDQAFANTQYLKNITLSDSLETIGKGAFFLSKIETVDLSSNIKLKEISEECFYNTINLKVIYIPSSVEVIKKNAFHSSGLEQLTFLNDSKIEEIETEAFANTNLLALNLPKNLSTIGPYAFKGSKISSIDFSNNIALTSIGEYAFSYLDHIKSIDIPSWVQSIGFGAFANTKLESMTLPFVGKDPAANDNSSLFGYIFGANEFQNESVPETLEVITITGAYPIKANAFANLSNVREVYLSPEINDLGLGIFKNMSALTTLSLTLDNIHLGYLFGVVEYYNQNQYVPSSLRNIYLTGTNVSDFAFSNLETINNLTFAETITTIGEGAFIGMSALSKIVIPENVIKIGPYAFGGNDNASIYVMASTKPSGWDNDWNGSSPVFWNTKEAFEDGLYQFFISNDNKVVITKYLGTDPDVYIPKHLNGFEVIEIGEEAFAHNQFIKNLSIPDSVKVIGKRAFLNSSIEMIMFEQNSKLTVIDIEAFADTASLGSILLPASLTKLNEGAFKNSAIGEVDFVENSLLTLIDRSVFENTQNLNKIIIPASVEVINPFAFYFSGINEVIFLENGILKVIGEGAFSNTTNLVRIELPKSIEQVGRVAFASSGLTEVLFAIDGSLRHIDFGAFQNVSNLENIQLPFLGGDEVNTHFGYIFGASSANNQDFYLPKSLVKVSVYGTEIGKNAFYGVESIREVFIAATVLIIDENAFYNCLVETIFFEEGSLLKTIGYRAFYGATNLKNLDLPSSLEQITNEAFINTKALRVITFPASLISIGNRSFYDSGIEEIYFSENSLLESIGERAFNNIMQTTLVLPNSLKRIGFDAFGTCPNLLSITLPFLGANAEINENSYLGYIFGAAYGAIHFFVPVLETVNLTNALEIMPFAFYGLQTVKTVHLPDNLKVISNFAFSEMTNLESISIPDNVEIIGDFAFFNSGLKSVLFSDNSQLLKIGEDAFSNTFLESLIVPASVEEIGLGAFTNIPTLTMITLPFLGGSKTDTNSFGYIFGANDGYMHSLVPLSLKTIVILELDDIYDFAFNDLPQVEEIIIPNTYKKIGMYAFYNCGITSFIINKDVETIGEYAFYNSKITSLQIEAGSKLTSIGDYAFAEIDIRSFMIPKGVNELGSFVFENSSLEVLSFEEGSSLTVIKEYGFYGLNNLTSLTLPDSLVEIGKYAFGNARYITELVIGNHVTTIGRGALVGVNNLVTLTIPFVGGSKSLDEQYQHLGYLFDGLAIETANNFVPSTLLTVNVTNTTYVGDYAFCYLSNIKEINLPDNLVSFGHASFLGTSSLSRIVIPSSVSEISPYCFMSSGIEEIVFGEDSNIQIIRNNAFEQTFSLKSIYLPANVMQIESSAFNRSYIEEVTFGEGSSLEVIEDYTFYSTWLKKINLPSTIKSIGKYAFTYSNLSELSFDADAALEVIDDYAFSNMYFLTLVNLPKNINYFGKGVFFNCNNVTDLKAPYLGQSPEKITNLSILGYLFGANNYSDQKDYVPEVLVNVEIYEQITVPDYAFYNLQTIENITLSINSTKIGQYAFYKTTNLNAIVIPAKVSVIGEYAFKNSGVTSISFEEDSVLELISSYAFSDTVFERITIPASCKTIDQYAFNNATFSEFEFVEGSLLEYLGKYAFNNCMYLTTIAIPDSVTFIGNGILKNACSLSKITLPYIGASLNASTIFGYLFDSISHYDHKTTVPNSLEEVIITKDNEIYDDAFREIDSIKSIVLPNTIQKIGHMAFYNMANLNSINIPDSVSIISGYAFSNSYNITELLIPSSVTEIGNYAFSSLTNLTNLVIPNSVEKIEIGAFANTNLTSISLPFIGRSANAEAEYAHFSYVFGALTYNQPNKVPANLEQVTITGDTKVVDYAFYELYGIIELTFISSITEIGPKAFYKTNLYLINIGEDNPDYQNVDGVIYNLDQTELILYPRNLTEISFTVPSSVKKIRDYAFNNANLHYVYFENDNNLEEMGFGAFLNTQLFGLSVPFVGQNLDTNRYFGYPFGADTAENQASFIPSCLVSVTVLGGTELDMWAFANLSNILAVYLPSTLTKIGYEAFANTTSLMKIKIPKSVESISDYAFSSSGITEFIVEEGSNLVSIGAYALANTNNIEKISVPFVGASIDAEGNAAVFGAIFGASSYMHHQNWVPESLETVIITGGTSIINHGFAFIANLKNITFPNTLTTIGYNAFYGTGIKEYLIPASVTTLGSNAFGINTEVVTFEEGSLLETLSDNAFANLTNLKEVTLREGLLTIGYGAFRGTTSLSTLTIPESVTSIDTAAFANCVFEEIVIPKNVEYIGNGAFSNCNNLRTLTIPFVGITRDSERTLAIFGAIFGAPYMFDQYQYVPTSLETVIVTNTTTIKDYALNGLINIKSLTLPNTLTSLGKYIIMNSGIEVVTFEEGSILEQIDEYAFASTFALTTITIPSSVKYLNNCAFLGASGLQTIEIPSTILRIDTNAFSSTGLTEVFVPNTVTYIGNNAFGNTQSLTKISLPFIGTSLNEEYYNYFGAIFGAMNYDNQYSSIPLTLDEVIIRGGNVVADNAFYGVNVKKISLPASISTIGKHAFDRCGIEEITFAQNSVLSLIDEYAFFYAWNLLSIIIPESVHTINQFAFMLNHQDFIIYAKISEEPSSWDLNWKTYDTQVVWSYED